MYAGAAALKRTQGRDALIEGRMTHEQPFDAAADGAIGNAKGGELFGRQRLVHALEVLERCDHLVGAGKLRAAAVGTKLAPPREPHDDYVGQDAEQQLQYDDG